MLLDGLLDLAEASERDGRPVHASRSYQAALHLDPHSRAAAVNLAVLCKSLGQLPACCAAQRHAATLHAELRLAQPQRLCDGGPTFGMADCRPERLHEAATALRATLVGGGYSSSSACSLLGLESSELPTATALLLLLRERPELREQLMSPAASQPVSMLMLLFLLGAAVPSATVKVALGASCVDSLKALGLLLPRSDDTDGAPLLSSPIQVYPLSLDAGGSEVALDSCGDVGSDRSEGDGELLLATDWALESLLPTKLAVMPIGDDSITLARLAPCPRRRGARILDLCTGSGVQALAACQRWGSDVAEVVAVDVNPRALRFVAFNAALNEQSHRVRPLLSDVYSAVDSLIAADGDEDGEGDEGVGGPFDAILANPPFVAVPPPPPGASTHAEWALYADGGPDGARVLNAVVAGATTARLRPDGYLAIVSEFPNVRSAHQTLAGLRPGLDLALFYDPACVEGADEYAELRADERGWPWADADAHRASLEAHGVEHMGSGLVFAVQRGGTEPSIGACHVMEGAATEEEGLGTGHAATQIRAVCEKMLVADARKMCRVQVLC